MEKPQRTVAELAGRLVELIRAKGQVQEAQQTPNECTDHNNAGHSRPSRGTPAKGNARPRHLAAPAAHCRPPTLSAAVDILTRQENHARFDLVYSVEVWILPESKRFHRSM